MGRIHVGVLTEFTYPGRRKSFLQLIYYGKKYAQLRLMNTQNNFKNFLVNF
jgi:hypothetical protein